MPSALEVTGNFWLGLGMDRTFSPSPPLPSPGAQQYHILSSHIFIGPDVGFPNPNRLPLYQPSRRDPLTSSWGDQLPNGRGQKLVGVVDVLEPLVWQGRELTLCPESSPSSLHPRLRCCPSWNREATSNSAASMCCPSRWESWKEKWLASRGCWEGAPAG